MLMLSPRESPVPSRVANRELTRDEEVKGAAVTDRTGRKWRDQDEVDQAVSSCKTRKSREESKTAGRAGQGASSSVLV